MLTQNDIEPKLNIKETSCATESLRRNQFPLLFPRPPPASGNSSHLVGDEELYVKVSLLAKAAIRQNQNSESGIQACYPDPVAIMKMQEAQESSRCIHSILGGLVLPNCGMDDFQGNLSRKKNICLASSGRIKQWLGYSGMTHTHTPLQRCLELLREVI